MSREQSEKKRTKDNWDCPSQDVYYSYHTFILPFTWNMWGIKQKDLFIALKEVFDGNNDVWESTDLTDSSKITSIPEFTYSSIKELYKEYQYFYPHVRKTMWEGSGQICRNYKFKIPQEAKPRYHIKKRIKIDEKEVNLDYCLDIRAIRLRLVNTGVALFILDCGYSGEPDEDLISAIKNINDYGRRISIPFIEKNNSIVADELSIEIPGVAGIKPECFKSFIDDIEGIGNSEAVDAAVWLDKIDSLSQNHICDFIKQLLGYKSDYTFSSLRPNSVKDIQLIPILDDRMYVAYAISDKRFTEQIAKADSEGEYAFISVDKLSKSLYELAFVDPAGECSCPDSEMRRMQLKQSIYTRWAPYGSIYTLSPMGLGMITKAKAGSYLLENFLTCYREMLYISIIQRASIVNFSRETADIAMHFASGRKKIKQEDLRDIMNLQERHVAFDSQLLFSEVSSEQQAIEFYAILKDAFSIDKENQALEDKLTSLFEITTTELDRRLNSGVDILTWVSIILSCAALSYSIFFPSDVKILGNDYKTSWSTILGQDTGVWIFIALTLILLIAVNILLRYRDRRK